MCEYEENEYKIKRKASQIFELAFVSHHCIDFDGCCNVCTGHTDGSRVFRIYRFIRYHCTDIKQAEQTTSDQLAGEFCHTVRNCTETAFE